MTTITITTKMQITEQSFFGPATICGGAEVVVDGGGEDDGGDGYDFVGIKRRLMVLLRGG